MKRCLLAVALLASGCDFEFRGDRSGKQVGGEVVVYDPDAGTAAGWAETPGGRMIRCRTPVGTKLTWLGSGFPLEGKPGVWDRTRFVYSKDESTFVYFPARSLRPVPR